MLLALLLFLRAPAASATDLCPPTSQHQEWSVQCFQDEAGQRTVKPMFRNQLAVNRDGMTTIMIADPRELVAVDRQGRVVISGIEHVGDFDYPNAEAGIGRFFAPVRSATGQIVTKCGYFNADRLRIVIPAQYDYCQPFLQGKASVCINCVPYCSDPDCHDTIMVGGQGSVLAPDGSIRRTYAIRPLEQRCSSPAALHVGRLGGGRQWTECRDAAADPFGTLK